MINTRIDAHKAREQVAYYYVVTKRINYDIWQKVYNKFLLNTRVNTCELTRRGVKLC